MRATIRKPYPVFIGESLLRTFDFDQFDASTFVVITDTNVDRVLFRQLKSNRTLPSRKVLEIIVPASEDSKSMPRANDILRKLANEEVDRNALIIALGGGVVGDLAGFVASIYKRGIRYIQIPTTLLAQVDSSLGGKTAVNLAEGKNLVGTTYNPTAVISDIALIEDLPSREINNGLAELIKYGVIHDKKLFEQLEANIGRLQLVDYKRLITQAANIKLSIAQRDPFEKEYRKILNFGHTFAHAYEVASNYRVSHGTAVALGMIGEAHLAKSLNVLPSADFERIQALVRTLKPSVRRQYNDDLLIELMQRDKKSKHGRLYFVLPNGIGKHRQIKSQVAFPVAEHVVRNSLRYVSKLNN